MQAMNQEVFAALADALQRGEEVALVTITSSTGSTPQRVGAKMLVFSDGRTVGTIGGGCYENDAFWKAREAIVPTVRPSGHTSIFAPARCGVEPCARTTVTSATLSPRASASDAAASTSSFRRAPRFSPSAS